MAKVMMTDELMQSILSSIQSSKAQTQYMVT